MKIKIINKFAYIESNDIDAIEVDDKILLEDIAETKCFDVEKNCVIDYDNSKNLLKQKKKQEKLNKINELRNYLNSVWSWQMERYNAEVHEIKFGIRAANNFTISLENLIISRKDAVDEINRLEEEIKQL